jgi:hypothetical protein
MGGVFIPDEIPEKIHIIVRGCHVNHQSMNDLMRIDFLIPIEPVIGGVKYLAAPFTPVFTSAESRVFETHASAPLVFETRTITLMVLLSREEGRILEIQGITLHTLSRRGHTPWWVYLPYYADALALPLRTALV